MPIGRIFHFLSLLIVAATSLFVGVSVLVDPSLLQTWLFGLYEAFFFRLRTSASHLPSAQGLLATIKVFDRPLLQQFNDPLLI